MSMPDYDPWRYIEPDGKERLEREFPHPETGLPVGMYSTRTIDRVNQILEAEMEIREHDDERVWTAWRD